MLRSLLLLNFAGVSCCVTAWDCCVSAQATDLVLVDLALVEVESFEDKGGWVVDQQFMDIMGSPYLLTHGLGVPVPDAQSTLKFETAGQYRVWVRTRDWVA